MSFGFSVSDFISVGQLAWTVYKSCKGASGAFQEVSREVLTFHTVLKELEDEASNERSLLNRRGSRRRDELMMIIDHAKIALKDLDDIVNRYQKLGRNKRQLWDTVRFATEDVDTIRGKINFHTSAIGLFQNSLSAGSLARIEIVLDELVREVREGRRPATTVSAHETDDPTVWQELEKELADEGISKQEVELHKAEIKLYLKALLGDPPVRPPSISEIPTGFNEDGDDDDGEIWDSISVRMALQGELQATAGPIERSHQVPSTESIKAEATQTVFADGLSIQGTALSGSTTIDRPSQMSHIDCAPSGEMLARKKQQMLDAALRPDLGLSQSSSLFTNRPQRDASLLEDSNDAHTGSSQLAQHSNSVPAGQILSFFGCMPESPHLRSLSNPQPLTDEGPQIVEKDAVDDDTPLKSIFDASKLSLDFDAGKFDGNPKERLESGQIGDSSQVSILIVDLHHSEASRIAQAYLIYLYETYSAVKQSISKVQSAGHSINDTGATSYYSRIERMLSELFASKGIDAPPWTRREFKVKHALKYDYIIVLEDPISYELFRKETETALANFSSGVLKDVKSAKFSRFDNPNILDKPEYCDKSTWERKGKFEKRAKKGLEDVYQVVKFYCLHFLERELGLKETTVGFEKTIHQDFLLQERDYGLRRSPELTFDHVYHDTKSEVRVSRPSTGSDGKGQFQSIQPKAQFAVCTVESGKSPQICNEFQNLDVSGLKALRPSKSTTFDSDSLIDPYVSKSPEIHRSKSAEFGAFLSVQSHEKQEMTSVASQGPPKLHQPSRSADVLTARPVEPLQNAPEGFIQGTNTESLPQLGKESGTAGAVQQESDLPISDPNHSFMRVVNHLRPTTFPPPTKGPSSASFLTRKPTGQAPATPAGLFEKENQLSHSKSLTTSDLAARLSGPFDPLGDSFAGTQYDEERQINSNLHIKPIRSMADILTRNPRPSPSLESLLKLYSLAPDQLSDRDRKQVEGWITST